MTGDAQTSTIEQFLTDLFDRKGPPPDRIVIRSVAGRRPPVDVGSITVGPFVPDEAGVRRIVARITTMLAGDEDGLTRPKRYYLVAQRGDETLGLLPVRVAPSFDDDMEDLFEDKGASVEGLASRVRRLIEWRSRFIGPLLANVERERTRLGARFEEEASRHYAVLAIAEEVAAKRQARELEMKKAEARVTLLRETGLKLLECLPYLLKSASGKSAGGDVADLLASLFQGPAPEGAPAGEEESKVDGGAKSSPAPQPVDASLPAAAGAPSAGGSSPPQGGAPAEPAAPQPAPAVAAEKPRGTRSRRSRGRASTGGTPAR